MDEKQATTGRPWAESHVALQGMHLCKLVSHERHGSGGNRAEH